MIEGRKEGGWKGGRRRRRRGVLRGAKTEKQKNMEEAKMEGEIMETEEGAKFTRHPQETEAKCANIKRRE